VSEFQRWLRIAGDWPRRPDATYAGHARADGRAGLLLAPSSLKFKRGELATTIRIAPDERDAQARIVLAGDGEGNYVSAGVGGHGACYVVEAFESRYGHQRPLALTGVPDIWAEEVRLTVHVSSRHLTIEIGETEVLTTTMPRALQANDQIGLFAWSEAPVVFEKFAVRSRPPQVFVALPFSGYDDVFAEIIAPLHTVAEIVRGDTKRGPGSIPEQIESSIAEADVVIADVSATNANVFFEAGYAFALRKPVILLAKKRRKLPFDVSTYRCVSYGPSPEGRAAAAAELAQEFAAAVARPHEDRHVAVER
jgi:Nucleoside 2-deoxyribosyltransferase